VRSTSGTAAPGRKERTGASGDSTAHGVSIDACIGGCGGGGAADTSGGLRLHDGANGDEGAQAKDEQTLRRVRASSEGRREQRARLLYDCRRGEIEGESAWSRWEEKTDRPDTHEGTWRVTVNRSERTTPGQPGEATRHGASMAVSRDPPARGLRLPRARRGRTAVTKNVSAAMPPLSMGNGSHASGGHLTSLAGEDPAVVTVIDWTGSSFGRPTTSPVRPDELPPVASANLEDPLEDSATPRGTAREVSRPVKVYAANKKALLKRASVAWRTTQL